MWEERAWEMAVRVTPDARSLWFDAMVSVPRHELMPRWLEPASTTGDVLDPDGWMMQDGPDDPGAWHDAAYDPYRSVATQAGTVHADHAAPGRIYPGPVTGQALAPALTLALFRHAVIYPGCDILQAGTGCGYGTGLLAHRFGSDHVTSTSSSEYLTNVATGRLGSLGLRPRLLTRDPHAELPGGYDRIIGSEPLRAVPAWWLTALRPGGRMVLWLDGGVLITASTTPDGGADGLVERDRTALTATLPPHHDPPPMPGTGPVTATRSPNPVVNPVRSGELAAMLAVTDPGVTTTTDTDIQTGVTTTWLAHPDGSWARAAAAPGEPADVHQAGPRRLWDILDGHREYWLSHGHLPVLGARVRIDPDGTCHLRHGQWHAIIPAQPPATRP